jgi:arylsulfatase A-like enzyme
MRVFGQTRCASYFFEGTSIQFVWILFGLCATIFLPSPSLDAADAKRPNVLFIAIDDLNAWVGHLGTHPQARTPNIDRLAQRGVSFSRAYCAVPACEPSRAALMHGQRPWTTACYYNGDGWKSLVKEGEGLSAQFLNAGYHVAGAGKIYHSDEYFASEWSEYMPHDPKREHGDGVEKYEGYFEPLQHDLNDDDINDWQAVDYCIERLQSKDDNKPLFVACGLHKPHLPFAVPRKYYDPFPLDQIQLPPHRADDLEDVPERGIKMANPQGDHAKFLSLGRWKNAVQSYLAAIAYTDMNVGRLLDALDASPRRDNTIIVLWGDHGWSLGEKSHWRKFALWEEPTRAPLIWVAPNVAQKGKICSQPVDFMNIYPTLCELAGLDIPKHVEGTSLMRLLRDPQASWDLPAITTEGYLNHAVRTKQYRYIRYDDGSEELYDHRVDPNEWTNLANKPEMTEVVVKLKAMLPQENAIPKKVKAKKAAKT